MDIVVCADKKFIRFDGVLFKSICVNNEGEDISFHVVIDSTVSQQDKQKLENVVKDYDNKKIFFYLFDENLLNVFPNIRYSSTITKAAYYRLVLADLLPQNIDKVLYLDGDIIVRKNLKPLFDTDISQVAVAAVVDMDANENKKYIRLGYDKALSYFNSGVLLINLKYWRDNKVLSEFKTLLERHPEKIKHHDQDVMNFVFRNSKKMLPLTYNFQNGFLNKKLNIDLKKYKSEIQTTISDPVIVHFTCTKPWFEDCGHPWRSLYFKYEDMTVWQGSEILPTNKKKHSRWKRLMLWLHIHQDHEKRYAKIAPID